MAQQPIDTVFIEDFESGWGEWHTDESVWEVGVPLSGPGAAADGANCAGTNLAGDYPPDASTRLTSPAILMPRASAHPDLNFRNWFSTEQDADWCRLQISVDDGQTWDNLESFSGNGEGWSTHQVSLQSYASQEVMLGFLFTSNGSSGGAGWYVDGVAVTSRHILIDGPTDTFTVALCEPDTVCVPLAVEDGAEVQVSGGTWANDTLCFVPPDFGLYSLTVIASKAAIADTVEVTVDVVRADRLTLSPQAVAFKSWDTATVLPDPQYLHIESPCGDGAVTWSVSLYQDPIPWLALDRTSGSNPDSIELSVAPRSYAAGVYSARLEFWDQDDGSFLGLAQVLLFVEPGAATGTDYVEPGGSVKVPIYMHTGDELNGFTIPLRYYTSQPALVRADSVTFDRTVADTAFLIPDSQVIIVERDVQQPPLPDSNLFAETFYVAGYVYFTTAVSTAEEVVTIDTVTTYWDGVDYAYRFVDAAGDTTVPSYAAGAMIVGDPVACASRAGDVNMDLVINATDIIYLVNFLFKSGPEPQPWVKTGDVNCDGAVNSSDVICQVNYTFKAGAEPCIACY